jgi:hypothetical protein
MPLILLKNQVLLKSGHTKASEPESLTAVKLKDLRGHQSPKLLLPTIERLLANAHIARNLRHLRPLLGLRSAKAICRSVNRDRFIEKILLAGFLHLGKIFLL